MLVSVILAARNEQAGIHKLLQAITWNMTQAKINHEIIVVDDSDDKTAFIAQNYGARVINGQRKGLGQAIIDGINASKGEVIINLDADGQHSPFDMKKLLEPILAHGVDLVIGSRYVKNGNASGWTKSRRLKSELGVNIMYPFVGVRDANSGFFAFRKEILNGVILNGKTWKIMLEVLFKGHWISKQEVPIVFGDRVTGKSKRSSVQVRRDALNIARLVIQKHQKLIKFVLVGGIGNIWHFGLLYILTEYGKLWYGLSAIIAIEVTMTSNFLFHHFWTFKGDKSSGFWKGYAKFAGTSAVADSFQWSGLILLTQLFGIWYMLSSLLATFVSVFIKYFVSRRFIWGQKPKRLASDADYEWVSFYQGLPWQKIWKQKLARITRELAGNAGKTLEVGMGSSPNGILVNHADYIGIDPNLAKVDYMKSKNLKDATFIHGDLDTVTFMDKNFDTVLFIEVIEHLKDMDDARFNLSQISLLLKDGGQAIIATPNFGSWTGKTQDYLYGVFQKGAYKEEHQTKFSLPSLIELARQCGLTYDRSVIPMGADMVCRFIKKGG
jgi:dolichol-phosphate mannosyltransferase